jgi:hypothetical protein
MRSSSCWIVRIVAACVSSSGLVSAADAVNFLPEGVAPEAVSEEPTLVALGAEAVVCIALKTGRNAVDLSEKIITAHNREYFFAMENDLKLGRGALEISAHYEEPDGSWATEACRSLHALPARSYPDAPDLKFYEVPAGQAVHALHRGAHRTIKQTIDRVEAFIAARGLRRIGPLTEFHFNHKPPEQIDEQISVVTVYVE